ncbi:MAG: type II secretion system F family protein, partial [Pseudomonadota bacterium]
IVRLIWPLVNVILHTVVELVPTSYLMKHQRKIESAGLSHTILPVELVALQVLCAIFGGSTIVIATLLGVWSTVGFGIWPVLGLFLMFSYFGWYYPLSWVAKCRKAYLRQTLRTLPAYLDMITMCCEAGLNLSGAFQQAVSKGKSSPLKTELERVLREMRTGVTRIDAMRRMGQRMDNPIVISLMSNLIQAEIMGASLAATLRSIAEQRRTERFQAAEKLAMEAPTKMIFPLVAFIFPVTFLIIGFPIAMKMKEALSG